MKMFKKIIYIIMVLSIFFEVVSADKSKKLLAPLSFFKIKSKKDKINNSNKVIIINKRFGKYGLSVNDDLHLICPTSPKKYGQTPLQFNYLPPKKPLLSEYKDKLLSIDLKNYDADLLLSIVNKIFSHVVGEEMTYYGHIIIMDNKDFDLFKSLILPGLGIGDFSAINMDNNGGGTIIAGKGNIIDRILLLLHELGHSLYPVTNNRFEDEFHAMCFEFYCRKLLREELLQIGISVTFSDYTPPSIEHKNAYHAANKYLYENNTPFISKCKLAIETSQ